MDKYDETRIHSSCWGRVLNSARSDPVDPRPEEHVTTRENEEEEEYDDSDNDRLGLGTASDFDR